MGKHLFRIRKLKAQITLFMILGIVILGAFAFVYYLTNYIAERQLNAKVDKVYSDLIQNTPIQLYVSRCVEDSLDNGLRMISSQGGFIFSGQEGSWFASSENGAGLPDPRFVLYADEYGERNVTLVQMGILPLTSPNVYSNLEDYPCRSPLYGNLCPGNELVNNSNPCYFMWDSEITRNFLGCMPGPSSLQPGPMLHDTANSNFGKKRFAALSGFVPGYSPSIADQLRVFVSNRTAGCVNFTGIALITGQNITAGYPITEITIGANDVTANMQFPVVISLQGYPPITRMVEFRASEKFRIRQIRDAVDDATTRDNRNLGFLLMPALQAALTSNYLVEAEQSPSFDIVKVEDRQYVAAGDAPYVFSFARENRWPALDYITDKPESYKNSVLQGRAPYYFRNESYGYDYFVYPGSRMEIVAFAHDPDEEDILVFNFSGWKEDYEEFWNSTKETELRNTMENCSWYPEKCMYKVYPEPGFDPPRLWTSSNQEDYGKGGYLGMVFLEQITEQDIGHHIVKVNVSDGTHTDWQDVRILVIDIPNIEITGQNEFWDIDNRIASIEDPYFLDARGSTVFCEQGMLFDYQDGSEITEIYSPIYGQTSHTLYSGNMGLVNFIALLNRFPTSIREDLDINDVSGAFSNFTGGGSIISGSTGSVHKVNLTVALDAQCSNLRFYSQMEVNVSECVPHRNNTLVYPYNMMNPQPFFGSFPRPDTLEDPFQANHTCCDIVGGDYSITTGNECFRFESWAFLPRTDVEHYPATLARQDTAPAENGDLDRSSIIGEPEDLNVPVELPPGINWHGIIGYDGPDDIEPWANDIFHRVVSQACSGGRGNACTGTITDEWQHALECRDMNRSFGEDETCSGPPTNNWPAGCQFGFYNDGTPCNQWNYAISCTNYWGYDYPGWQMRSSFEFSYLRLPWANGVCNEHWRLSTPGINGYANGGFYLCQGGCGNGGCTNAINCFPINAYNDRIPIVDHPGNFVETLRIFGWSEANNPAFGWTLPEDETAIPPPSGGTIRTWCDGQCFSNGGTQSSQTQSAPNNLFDFCTTREYTGWDRRNLPGMTDDIWEDSINFTWTDIDLSRDDCHACTFFPPSIQSSNANQLTNWVTAGEPVGEYPAFGSQGCCGDDSGEYTNLCTDSYPLVPNYYNPNCIAPTSACCNNSLDCVNSVGACVPTGQCHSLEGYQAFCNQQGSASQWEDPDESQHFCEAAGCGYQWNGSNPLQGKCCGDDLTYDDWSSSDAGFGCCCNGNRIGIFTDDFCQSDNPGEGRNLFCLEGSYCTQEIFNPVNNGLFTGTDDLRCGCNLASVSSGNYGSGALCELPSPGDNDNTVDGICAITGVNNFDCAIGTVHLNTDGDYVNGCSGAAAAGMACDRDVDPDFQVNGLCTNEGLCCVRDVVNNGVSCGCRLGLGGEPCDTDTSDGIYVQDGVCAINETHNWDCVTNTPISHRPPSHEWHNECAAYQAWNCDNTLLNGAWSKEGMCAGANCCLAGFIVLPELLPFFQCGDESLCDANPEQPCSPVDIPAFDSQRICDNTPLALEGEGCEPCNNNRFGEDGRCEQVCGAAPECDEQLYWNVSGPGPRLNLCINTANDQCMLCEDGEPYAFSGGRWHCGCEGHINAACDNDRDGIFDGTFPNITRCQISGTCEFIP